MHGSKISNIHKNMIIELRNASFFEHVFPCKSEEGWSSSKRTLGTVSEKTLGPRIQRKWRGLRWA